MDQTPTVAAAPKGPRQIHTHASNLCNNAVKVEVLDQPGDGGANHRYLVTGPDFDYGGGVGVAPRWGVNLNFQNGPIKEKGVNGITNEVLLAIVQDRLEGFQRGPFACEENATALMAVQSALAILAARTKRRDDAGVEGTHGTTPGEAGHAPAA